MPQDGRTRATITQRHDLFVSYAEADRAWVEGYLLDALRRAEVDYTDEAAFPLGVPRLEEFERAVTESKRTLLVLSKAYLADNWARYVEVLAQSYGMETSTWPVIPLLLEPVSLPVDLAALTRLDATDPATYGQVIERLCRELERTSPPAGTPPPCPYPGMAPFSEHDKNRFFGRDSEVAELVQHLRLQRFLTLIGPSGSGKSSLIYAGLIPALRDSDFFGPGQWTVRSVRPGQKPLDELTRALEPEPAPLEAAPQTSGVRPESRPFLLVIDQFEEVFAVANQNLAPFYSTLESLTHTQDCYVVLTVRADFYSELMRTPIWHAVQAHRYEVLPLDDAGLREAIIGPAQATSVYVEPALVERLIADAANEPGALPLVQETLVLLWRQLERHYLPLRAYAALVPPPRATDRQGGVRRTGVQVAIDHRGDAALSELQTPAQQALARRMMVQLVQFGEGRPDTRRQQTVAQLADPRDDQADLERALEVFTRHRLITVTGQEDSPARRVDLAHEALIQGWRRMREWLAVGRADLMRARQLRQQVDDWNTHARDESLLYGGSRLADAQAYAERHRGDLRPDELAFLAASAASVAARERSRYLGQAAGGAVGAGLGYGIAFALAFAVTYTGPNGLIYTVTTLLFMFAMGQAVGFAIGLSLWLARRAALGRLVAAVASGGFVGALTYVLFLQFTLGTRPDALHALVGALLGVGIGLGVAISRARWRRLAGATVGGLLAVTAAAALGGITWGLPIVLAGGLALGVFSGAGFELTTAEMTHRRNEGGAVV